MLSPRLLTALAATVPLLRGTFAQTAQGTSEAVPNGPSTSSEASGYSCDPNACQLPNCLCASTHPPGGLSPSDVPQFVTWTSDDAMNVYTQAAVKTFLGHRQNPNGCPVRSTYFGGHMVDGNEIACHTVNHQTNSSSNPKELSANIDMQLRWSGIHRSSIQGFRAPFLSPTADTFQILHDQGFTYDSSLTSTSPIDAQDTDAFWPYTLDSGLANACLTIEGICKGEPKLPGLWEIPMYSIFDNDSVAVSVMDPYLGSDTDMLLDMLKDNFEKHYNGNRQPFGLYTHPAHLMTDYPGLDTPIETIDMLNHFLDWVQQHDNVWFVTNEQLLSWVQQPTAAADVDKLDFMQCQLPDVSDDICNGMSPNQDGLLVSCSFDVLSWGASSCYGCPSALPTVDEPAPEQDTSDGREERHPVPDNCGTAWWDPLAGKCLCAGEDCVFKDTAKSSDQGAIASDGAGKDGDADDQDHSSDSASDSINFGLALILLSTLAMI